MIQNLRTIVLMGLFLASTSILFAQANKKESWSLNAGPEVLFPEGDFRGTHNTGLGGSVKLEYTFGKHLSATINTGLSIFSGRADLSNPLGSPRDFRQLRAIPVKAGTRYYLGNFYMQGEAGVVFTDGFINAGAAVFSLGVGDKIRIGGNKIDLSARQELWTWNSGNLYMAVIRIAYEIVW